MSPDIYIDSSKIGIKSEILLGTPTRLILIIELLATEKSQLLAKKNSLPPSSMVHITIVPDAEGSPARGYVIWKNQVQTDPLDFDVNVDQLWIHNLEK